MCTEKRHINLGLCGESCPEGNHIIFIYNSDDEKKRTMAKFLKGGLDENEKVLYLVNDVTPEEMREEFSALGVKADASEKAFDMLEAHYKQCPDNYFSREYMLGVVGQYYQGALEEGYDGARGAGEMSWALEEGRTTMKDLLTYEAQLNAVLVEHPLTTVCQYDARRFSGQVIMDMLSVHPMAIVRGQLVRNPYYMQAGNFLDELENRPSM